MTEEGIKYSMVVFSFAYIASIRVFNIKDKYSSDFSQYSVNTSLEPILKSSMQQQGVLQISFSMPV